MRAGSVCCVSVYIFHGNCTRKHLTAHRLNGTGAGLSKYCEAPRCGGAPVRAGELLVLQIRAGDGFVAGIVAVVQERIGGGGRTIEPRVALGANLQAKSARERKRHESIITLHRRSCSAALRN